jgi:hypothetical protein
LACCTNSLSKESPRLRLKRLPLKSPLNTGFFVFSRLVLPHAIAYIMSS